MSQVTATQQVLQSLFSQGVENIVVCSGSRNACFVETLSKCKKIKSYFHFEERSAGFYALGLSRKLKQPVAVVVTSGTAVANLFPAIVEAYYGGGQLIVVSADRPKSYRGSGAPQAIDQAHFFANYVEKSLDFAIGETPRISIGSGSMQLNICYQEPVLDESVKEGFDLNWEKSNTEKEPASVESFGELPQFARPLVIISRLNKEELSLIQPIVENSGCAVLVEGDVVSEASHMFSHVIFEEEATHLIETQAFDAVIRVGGVPVCRLWRNLEGPFSSLPVLSFSQLNFSGLGRESTLVFCRDLISPVKDYFSKMASSNFSVKPLLSSRKIRQDLYKKFPKSEANFFKTFAQLTSAKDSIFLGNSLPIRNWIDHARESQVSVIESCRGANGIDGLISLSLGLCRPIYNQWCILGDLTTMYDFAGLWALRFLQKNEKFNLIVVNNGGGKIFSRLYENPNFQCQHNQDFSSMAKFYNMNYVQVRDVSELAEIFSLQSRCNLIEWKVDSLESQEFYLQWQKLN